MLWSVTIKCGCKSTWNKSQRQYTPIRLGVRVKQRINSGIYTQKLNTGSKSFCEFSRIIHEVSNILPRDCSVRSPKYSVTSREYFVRIFCEVFWWKKKFCELTYITRVKKVILLCISEWISSNTLLRMLVLVQYEMLGRHCLKRVTLIQLVH